MRVTHADDDGFFVCSAGAAGCSPSTLKNGVEIGRTENNGMYVIEAGTNGVYANTTQASGEWGFYTPDKIRGSNVLLHSLSLVAQVGGADALAPGDLVAAAGVADPLPGSTVPVPQVRLADGQSGGVVGVVERRLALVQAGELLPADDGGAPIEAPPPQLHSADGPTQPGDYVAITIYGAALVKVDGAAAIGAGQRLTASSTPGQVRALRALKVQLADGTGTADMLETAPVIGVALDAPRAGWCGCWSIRNSRVQSYCASRRHRRERRRAIHPPALNQLRGLRTMSQPCLETLATTTFVVHFWREWTGAESRWRGRIEHMQSGRRADLLDVAELLGFLERFGIGAAALPADQPA